MKNLDTLWQYQQADLVTDDFERKAKNSPRRVKLLKLRNAITEMQDQLQGVKDKLESYQGNIDSFQKEMEQQDTAAEGLAKKLTALEDLQSEEATELASQLRAAIDKTRSVEKQLSEMASALTGMDRQQKEVRMKAMKARAEYTQLKEVYDEEFKQTSEELGALRQKRNEIGESIEPALLQKYKNIKATCTPPMAKLDGDQCGGCHMSLPSVVMKALKEGKKVVECENCGRILYQP